MAQQAPAFASPQEALVVLESVMGYLATANAAQMATETQADALRVLEKSNSMGTAARSVILNAFTSAQGHVSDADHSPRTWLMYKTRIILRTGGSGWIPRSLVRV